MSELIKSENRTSSSRRWLLTSTCVATLLLNTGARAGDSGQPSVWIEIGGQLQRVTGGPTPFAPEFVTRNLGVSYDDISPLDEQHAPRYAIDGEGALSFAPGDDGWTFSIVVNYGRSNRGDHVHQQGTQLVPRNNGPLHTSIRQVEFDDTAVQNRGSHVVVDFMAGKDAGIGMLGKGSSILINAGVRFAQINMKSNIQLHELPDPYYKTNAKYSPLNPANAHHHSYYAVADHSHSFHGVGPTVSWSGSTPVIGRNDGTELALDWGANAAVLFGRQKVSGAHQTTGRYFQGAAKFIPYGPPLKSEYVHPSPISRSRSVVVPNIGGFVSLSYKFPNAKLRLGYRADFFFGAIDGGIDTRQPKTLGFHGPFATISVGLGG